MSTTSTVPAVNVLIWLSVKPILKLAAPAAGGFFLTRAGLYPVAGSRAASQIVLNIALPSLLFAKIVPSINQENVSAIGPIVLVAVSYMVMSIVMGLCVRTFTRTPHNFRWGIIAASGWSNWGDLPTSVAQTVCAGAPFAAGDEDLAVAYVAIFILVFYITLFPLNGLFFIKADYTHPYLPPSDAEDGAEGAVSASGLDKWWRRAPGQLLPRRRGHRAAQSDGDISLEQTTTKGMASEIELPALGGGGGQLPPLSEDDFTPLGRAPSGASRTSVREIAGAAVSAPIEDTSAHNRRVSFGRERKRLRMERKERERLQTIVGSRAGSRAPSELGVDDEIAVIDDDEDDEVAGTTLAGPASREAASGKNKEAPSVEMKARREWNARRVGRAVWGVVGTLVTPPTISLVISLIIALVNVLKALFTTVDGGTFHPTAPDGNPPLAIILDTATFIGNASVPLSLTVLGSALARMRLPRPLSKLPVASICSLALVKLVALPIFGFLIVQALVKHTSLVAADNQTLIFVMTYFSVVPTATSQVSLSQIFAPENGESNCDILSAYLIFQYFVFSISSVVLTSVTLSSIF